MFAVWWQQFESTRIVSIRRTRDNAMLRARQLAVITAQHYKEAGCPHLVEVCHIPDGAFVRICEETGHAGRIIFEAQPFIDQDYD